LAQESVEESLSVVLGLVREDVVVMRWKTEKIDVKKCGADEEMEAEEEGEDEEEMVEENYEEEMDEEMEEEHDEMDMD
jgi:hypothetical protein